MDRRVGGSFASKASSNIVTELQQAFKDKLFDKAKVKNRMKYLKTKFQKAYDLFKGGTSGFGWDSNKSMWIAEPQVWKAFIGAKLEAAKWMNKPIPHYENMEIMYANDRENDEFSQNAKEMRPSKKRKSWLFNVFTDDLDALLIKEGFNYVAKAIVISSQTLLKACPQIKMSAKEIWQLVDELGLEGKIRRSAYVFLVKNLDMLDTVCSTPPEEQKEILLDLLG